MPDAIVEREGHVLVITMNRPHRLNALSGAMLIRMYDAMTTADTDDDGMPDDWERTHDLDPVDPADRNGHALDTEYTNLEVYLASLAAS